MDGCILPGITRDSILKLTRDREEFKDVDVEEREFTIEEFIERYENGSLIEIFMSGTAAVVVPVDLVTCRGKDYKFSKDNRNYSERVKNMILDI